jgi:acylphosphatase
MKRVRIKIYGLVQGVFFRANIRRKAEQLGIGGWVRNNPDGSVEAIFEGEDEKVEQMIRFCKRGPPGAMVEKVEVEEEEYKGEFEDFSVRFYYEP